VSLAVGHRRGPAVLVGAAGLLLGVGALVPVAPGVIVGVVCGLAYMALVVLRPKAFVGVALLIVLFATTGQQLTGVSAFTYADDAVAITAIVALPAGRLLRGRALRLMPGLVWFGGFAALGLLSDLANHVPTRISEEGFYLALKGIGFGFAVAQLDWTLADVRRIVRIGAWVIGFILVCCALNLIAPHAWTSRVLVASLDGGYRLGIQSLVGPFIHPGNLGQVAALCAIAILAYRRTHGRSRLVDAMGIATILAAALSFRRKAVTGLLLGGLTVTLRHRPATTLLVLAVTLPAVIVLSWSQITAVVDRTSAVYLGQDRAKVARTVLYTDSAVVARDSFPLGAGFGRYGTHTAIAHYSPLYWELGFPHVYGLAPGGGTNGDFASDTFWPGVLGETGLFGLIAFAGGLLAVFRRFSHVAGDNVALVAFLGLVGMGWSVEFLVESFAAPTYVAPPVYPFLFALAGLATAVTPTAAVES
jgi:hypothetical protein